MLDLDCMKSQLEKVIRSQDRDPPELAKSFDTDDIDALIREVEKLRDDSEALRLLAEMQDYCDPIVALRPNAADMVWFWDVIDELGCFVIASGSTPLAAVQAAKQKLEQEQG